MSSNFYFTSNINLQIYKLRVFYLTIGSPPKWPSTSLVDDFFHLTDSRRPPAELKVASELSDQNPVGEKSMIY